MYVRMGNEQAENDNKVEFKTEVRYAFNIFELGHYLFRFYVHVYFLTFLLCKEGHMNGQLINSGRQLIITIITVLDV